MALYDRDTEDRRFELKYRLSYVEYLMVRHAILIYMKKDKYTQGKGDKGYYVRSLYFDSDDYRAYHEKMSGDSQRLKLRIRTYNSSEELSPKVRAEIKMRKGNLVLKRSSFVSIEGLKNFLRSRSFNDDQDQVLIEFEKNARAKILLPKVLIEYYREGYESRLESGLRITFDHRVKSAHSKELFPRNPFFREHNRGFVIMEAKFNDSLPRWMRDLVHSHGLKIIANSKFAQGIQLSRKDLCHPGGAIIVR